MLKPTLATWQSRAWTATSAIVLKNGYRDVYRGGYQARVRYAYVARGVRRVSDRVAFGHADTFFWKTSLNAFLAHYPKGRRIICYVDPRNADRAVLNRAFSWYNVVIGVGAALIGLFIGASMLTTYAGMRNSIDGSSSN